MDDVARPATTHESFGAFRHPGFRYFLILSSAAMMADNVEHVVTYWAAFQKFHSSVLGGFAVVSHGLPYLLLSVYVGGLSDRFDPRRLIRCGMLLFAAGFLELSFDSISQALAQIHGPDEIRGRMFGVYSMASLGQRTFSGLSGGVLGGLIGVHASLSSRAAP